MTPQFTTPCYVRVDDPIKRKEVCDKLEQMGREKFSQHKDKDPIILANDLYYIIHKLGTDIINSIDCGTNTDLFLALAGMRNDTDLNQLFKFDNSNELFASKFNSENEMWRENESLGLTRRRATAKEIIEYFNKKSK